MLHLHSFLRWALLLLLITAIVQSLIGLIQKKPFTDGNGKVGLYLMMVAHIQLLLGLVLYFTEGWASAPMAEAMQSAEARFWKVEHISAMIISIVLISIGRIRSKKLTVDKRKHRTSLIFYGIALLLILSSIPWEIERLY